jgi:hypothetical protein
MNPPMVHQTTFEEKHLIEFPPLEFTFVKVQDGQSDDVRPRRTFAESNAVAGTAKQFAGRHQIAILGRFEFQS